MSFCDLEPTAYEDLLREACGSDEDALTFLRIWNKVVHEIDDEIDEAVMDPEAKLRRMVHMNVLYSTNFYRAHAPALSLMVAVVTNAYADSVAWEKSEPVHSGEARMADVFRCQGNEMALAVAFITGGYERMRNLSPRLWRRSWEEHHDQETGEPK